MAKKFFNNRVYNTKRTIINIIIIGVCVIGIILCFIITSNSQVENKNTPESSLSIKKEVTVEINEDFNTDIFFSKIENIDLNQIQVNYPENFDVARPGSYEVELIINEKSYNSTLNIIDTTKPTLKVKEVTIQKGDSYNAEDFVVSCTDNSESKCIIDFYKDGTDSDGNIIDYTKFKTIGSYSIKISATDYSGNQVIEETKLHITGKNQTTQITPPTTSNTSCKYGNNEYDTTNYLVAVDVTNNKCAISLDLYKDTNTAKGINKLMETETSKIKKDVDALNLSGTLALNRKVTAVVNKTGEGIVGYELHMTVTITQKDTSSVVADYKVDSDGKRVFKTNPHGLK